MNISVASGKGGTGKTTVATNLALSLKDNVQLLDCDVEEPNSHIFVKPHIKETKSVFVQVPKINKEKCTGCGKCGEVCEYNAIAVVNKKVLVFPELCHGCGSCSYFCPENAIEEENKEIGITEVGKRGKVGFVHGKLHLGQMMAPPVIKDVKNYIGKNKISIIDAPPGTSCPVITAIQDTDFVILVTEPTPFGLNDLKLGVEVVRKLGLRFGVVINRSDLGNDETDRYCREERIPVLMRIPFKKEIAEAYSKGKSIVENSSSYKKEFVKLFDKIYRYVKESNKEDIY